MPKLTPEARKALKKQKIHEKKLRLANQKMQLKRDHLEREMKYRSHTIRKLEKDWRDMLVKIVVPRMKQELEFAWRNFERVVDCKDFVISLLMNEIDDAEEQYMRNLRIHLENMDKMMNMFSDQMDELKEDYTLAIKELENRCDSEQENINNNSSDGLEYLKTMLHQLEINRKEQYRMKRAEFYSRLDEVEMKNQVMLQKLRANLETKYQNIFEDTQQFITNYKKQIKDRKKEYALLKEQDDAIQELITQQFKQIKKNYDIIKKLKHQLIDLKQTDGNRLLDLQAERQYFSNSFITLKTKLEMDKKDDFNKLKRLSEGCAGTFDYLEGLSKKGEMILNLAVVCRKLETQKEKILPFPIATQGIANLATQKWDDDYEISEIRKELELFWQRIGQAYSVYYVLCREKRFLTEENNLLIDTHNDYCEKLMYPDVKIYRTKASVNKIDANMEIRKYRMYEHGKKRLFHIYDLDI